jgi:hypothetical protein
MSKKKSSVLTDRDIAIVPRVPEEPADVESQPEIPSYEEVLGNVLETIRSGFTFGTAPVPTKRGRTAGLKYPIDQLKADSDQFFDVPAAADKVKSVSTSIRTFAYRNGLAVILREVPGAVRVWRKAEKATKTATK